MWAVVDMIPSKEEWLSALHLRHGEELQTRISDATVAVCGLGGLGSNIAPLLVRVGVGRLILIDFDRVDITNLHRQHYNAEQIGMYKTDALKDNLHRISAYTDILTHTEKATEENIDRLLSGADIICEAFDGAEAKAMLTNHVLEHYPDKYLVAASGMAGLGSANSITTRKITDRFYLCGDGISDASDGEGLVCSRVAICAAHQAHAVVRILANRSDI